MQPATSNPPPQTGVIGDPIPFGLHIGVDIGQKLDPTALIVVELQRRGYETVEPEPLDHDLCPEGSRRRAFMLAQDAARGPIKKGGETHYVARLVQRLPLGTSYPAVARRLAEIDTRLRSQKLYPGFWVDATGVGKPIVDLLRSYGLTVHPVYLNGSDQAVSGENRELRLGKCLLVSRLQLLLQAGRIHLPATPEAGVLVQELLDYEIRVNDNAHAEFGAFTLGSHDDLATALGLACWDESGWGVLGYSIPPIDVIEQADRSEVYW
jgi:hypothetical protein